MFTELFTSLQVSSGVYPGCWPLPSVSDQFCQETQNQDLTPHDNNGEAGEAVASPPT